MSETQTDTLNFRRLLPVLVIVFVDVMGLTIIIPIIPFYALAFDATPLIIGLLVSCYPLMQFLFVPILGALSDRIGRKPVLAAAQVGTFTSLLIMGFASNLWMLFLARLVDGITGANLATVQSAITDSTSPQNRAKGLGLIGAIFGISFILGPVLSGVALRLSGNNYSAPAFMAAGFALVSILLTTFVFEETLPPEKRGQGQSRRHNVGRMIRALSDPKLGVLFLLVWLLQTIFGSFQATFAPFTLNRLGLNSFGNAIFFATFGLVIAFVQGGLVGPLSKRFGERRLIFVGLASFAMGFLLTSFTPQQVVPWYTQQAMIDELTQQTTIVEGEVEVSKENGAAPSPSPEQLALLPPETNKGTSALIYMLLALLPVPFGFALMSPNISSLITKRADPKQIGEALGLNAAFMALGTATGPSIGGIIFDFLGPQLLYAIIGLAAIGLLFIMLNRLRSLPLEKQHLGSVDI
ncbi:MFS transporter [Chloroflexi bacterium TSY]|nr:MFS transporter [Chloroflexi bacterium TSY]